MWKLIMMILIIKAQNLSRYVNYKKPSVWVIELFQNNR